MQLYISYKLKKIPFLGNHPEFFNKKTIYSDLIDKLDSLKLVEPLDLRITTKN